MNIMAKYFGMSRRKGGEKEKEKEKEERKQKKEEKAKVKVSQLCLFLLTHCARTTVIAA